MTPNNNSLQTTEAKLTAEELKKMPSLKRINYELTQRKTELNGYLNAFGIHTDTFITMFTEMAQQNPELINLQKYQLTSWIIAAKNAARTGFVPDSLGQYAYIIPRKRNVGSYERPDYVWNVYYQLGYLALKKMMQDHDTVRNVACEIVYENDIFEMVKLPVSQLIHKPALKDRGNRIGAYAAIFYKDRLDAPEYVWMEREQIEAIAANSEGIKKALKNAEKDNKEFVLPEYSPWNPKNDPNGWMWLKCVIRALAKKEDLNDRINQAVKMDISVDASYEEVQSDVDPTKSVYVPIQGEHEERKVEARNEKHEAKSKENANAIMGKKDDDFEMSDEEIAEMERKMEEEPSQEELFAQRAQAEKANRAKGK